MEWWIAAAGLALLFLLFLAARKKPILSRRDVSPEASLSARMKALAGQAPGRRWARLLPPASALKGLEKDVRFLNGLRSEEGLPASRQLCDNGRFLQEEAASLRPAPDSVRLTAFPGGESRVAGFARVFLSHTAGELRLSQLEEALAVWQKEQPLEEEEWTALPQALRGALLLLLGELAHSCVREQAVRRQAERLCRLLEKGRERRAMALFHRYGQNDSFLEKLFSRWRQGGFDEQLLWLENQLDAQGRSAEEVADREHLRQIDEARWVGNALAALHTVGQAPWSRLLEDWSELHQLLCQDDIYPQMDEESRAYYRRQAARISRDASVPAREICEAALSLASAAETSPLSHVGYYLIDEGLAELVARLYPKRRFLPPRLFFRLHGRPFYFVLSAFYFSLLLALAGFLRLSGWLWLPFALTFWLTGRHLFFRLYQRRAEPRRIPRMQVDRLEDAQRTLMVCPAPLLDPAHALSMVKTLSILHCANPDPNLHFLLLGDFRDSLTGSFSDDGEIVSAAAEAIRALRESTGHEFFYLQRERVYHAPDHLYMGRERKRGSLNTLLKLLQGEPVEDRFAYASVPPETLQNRYRYVITVDSGTFLPPGAALRMVGAMLHPLQRRCVGPDGWRGVSVLQPRMEAEPAAVESRLSLLLDGSASDTALTAEFFSGALHSGTFQGNGILDPAPFLQATEGKILPCAILNHALPEGQLAGCAYASDIALYETLPQTLQSFLTRLHRRTRGDWQLLPYVLPFFPRGRHTPRKSFSGLSRWKLLLNLLRSLESALRVLLLFCLAAQGNAGLFWAVLLIPELPGLFPLTGVTLASFLTRLTVLPLNAAMELDAVGRALYRLFVSRQGLLQWTPAVPFPKPSAKPPMLYFTLSMAAAGGMAAFSIFLRGFFVPGLVAALLWAALPFLLFALEAPRASVPRPTEYMREVLNRLAAGTMLYFETAVPGEAHALPADNVQIDPNKGISHRTSLTSIGLYLVSLLAAEKLRLLPAAEAARRIGETLSTLEALPKWEGHLYSQYDTRTLEPLPPRLVSSADSGLLAVCLTVCAQGLRVLLPALPESFHDLSFRADALADGINFTALFDKDAGLFWSGVHPDQPNENRSHDTLLASEARLLSFYAIMTGQVPLRHWYRLGRPRVRTRRGQSLLSCNGSLSEYLSPLLFHPSVPGTLLTSALKAALREQQAYRPGGVYGVSESGYHAFDPELYYLHEAFGLPSLALRSDPPTGVIAPYASVLALPLDLRRGFQNLLRLETMGMEGPMGFFEAADFSQKQKHGGFQIVRSHTSRHQGMILVTLCNLLCDQYIVRLFSDLPKAQAYRLLLQEKPGRRRGALRRPLRRRRPEVEESSPMASREASALCFPIDAHLLGGGGSTWLIDAQGGGYLARNGLMLTRFHEDCTLPSGPRLYLRENQNGGFRDLGTPSVSETIRFEAAQAVFTNEWLQIRTTLRMFVNPLDGAFLHHLTLENSEDTERSLEIVSYLEPDFCPMRGGEAPPADQNLFLQTEKLGETGAAARRRPKGENDGPLLLWHHLCADVPLEAFHIQTDRTAFLGRGRSVRTPRALETPAAAFRDTLGSVIDPCLSLRAAFTLPAKGRVTLAFATLCPGSKDKPSAFLERYDRPGSVLRRFDFALTRARVSARYLGLSAGQQNSVFRLAGCLCYTGQPMQFRYSAQNELPLGKLHGLRISGKLPLLLLECSGQAALDAADLLLRAHALFRMNGLRFDLALLCSPASVQETSLPQALSELCRKSHSHEWLGKDGGIHLLERERLSEEQVRLLRAAARLALSSDEGSLDEQLERLHFSLRKRPGFFCRADETKTALPAGEELRFFNGYGGFTPNEGDYQIVLAPGRQTPAPWCNPLCSQAFGTLAGESGLLFSYADGGQRGWLTRRFDDSVCPRGQENFFLRDEKQGLIWSVTRWPLGNGLPCRVTHRPGETVYECAGYGVLCRLSCFTDLEAPFGVRVLQLRNEGSEERTLFFFHTCVFEPGEPNAAQLCAMQRGPGGLMLAIPDLRGFGCLTGLDPEPDYAACMSAGVLEGLWGDAPWALCQSGPLPNDGGNAAVLCFSVVLRPGESKSIVSALGFFRSRSKLAEAVAAFRADGATLRLHRCRQRWEYRLSGLRFDLPDEALCLMLNRWLPYQVIASRLLMRAGFEQTSGAYEFREQLQDMLALLHTSPEVVREQLLLCAAHQFEEGDVQRWWQPPRFGARTRLSDDQLFLPFVTALYVRTAGDTAVLQEPVPYLRAEPLQEGQREKIFSPEVSERSEPLWQHCLRAIDHIRLGEHGLPLTGGGDWGEVMEPAVGETGESVWLGMFLCEVIRRFLPCVDAETAARLSERRRELLVSLERHGWDGAWYLRAYDPAGDKIGASANSECRIDLIPQCWAVFCGLSRERCELGMESVRQMLYDPDAGLLKLFTPPFDGESRPNSLAGYLPGVRENGGQSTLAACWAMGAFLQLGQPDRAWELALRLLPVYRSFDRQTADQYRLEPYVMAADLYAAPSQQGRGGRAWYTGSAAWYQYLLLEELLGFRKEGSVLYLRPVLPASWDSVHIAYRYRSATYRFHLSSACTAPVLDGEPITGGRILLQDDGRIHEATRGSAP